MHNELKKISVVHQPNSVVYSNENGYISDWLDTDPVIQSLKQQNEFIGTISSIESDEDIQTVLTQFVYDTVGRLPRNGDEVAIEDVAELWRYNGTLWVYFSNTVLKDATTTSKGVVQIGTGLNVVDGVVSLNNSAVTSSRTTITSTETTPSLSTQANTDYIFSNALTSLTIAQIESSFYHTSISFTTDSSFTFNSSVLTNWYDYSSTPTFSANTSYRIIISNGIGFLFVLNSDIHLTKTEASTTYIAASQKGANGGVATLDNSGKITDGQINYATSSRIGGIKSSFDGSTGTWTVITEDL